MSDVNELVDHFVAVVNRQKLVSLLSENVPDELRTGGLTDQGDLLWQIRSFQNPWIAERDETLPIKLPKLYKSLIDRYRFLAFEIGNILFFGNTARSDSERFSSDKGMNPDLIRHGFLQLGQPAGGSYDPVCFDTQRGGKTDAPIVRLDHEDILTRDGRITIREEIAPSFRYFIERVIADGFRNEVTWN